MNKKTKIAYITNIPTPYRSEMIEAWAKTNQHLKISVFYTHADDQGRGWDVKSIPSVDEKILPLFLSLKRYGNLNRGLLKVVADNDVIMVGGFEQATYFFTLLLAKLIKKPTILLFDGFSPARFNHENRYIVLLKKITAMMSDVYFANGKVGRDYLKNQLKVSNHKKIINQYLSHSDKYINLAKLNFHKTSKEKIRISLGLPTNRHIILSCGYLIERKRIDLIIDSVASIRKSQRPIIVIVGTGPLKEELHERAKRLGVDVIFTGFKQNYELAKIYLASDAMVLASDDDPWGLVVNEAMSASLPVIVSDACGAASDLVKHGENGYIFKAGNSKDLQNYILLLLKSDLTAMSHTSNTIIKSWTSEKSAENLAKSVEAAISYRR